MSQEDPESLLKVQCRQAQGPEPELEAPPPDPDPAEVSAKIILSVAQLSMPYKPSNKSAFFSNTALHIIDMVGASNTPDSATKSNR